MNRTRLLRTVAAAAVAVRGAASARPAAARPVPIRVASAPFDGYAQPYYGEEAGIFRGAGFAVETQVLANGAAMGAAVAGGTVDIALASPLVLANAHINGLPFACFAPAATYSSLAPTTQVIVAKNSRLQSAADLNGKTIGVVLLKSLGQLGVDAWMRQNDGDAASVKYAEMSYAAMFPALEDGRIAAALVSEPVLAEARTRFRVFADTDEAIGKAWYVAVWFANVSWIERNVASLHRFAAAISKTSVWANGHQAETAVILERLMKLSPDIGRTMHRARFSESFDPALMDPVLQTAYRGGLIKALVSGKELAYPGF